MVNREPASSDKDCMKKSLVFASSLISIGLCAAFLNRSGWNWLVGLALLAACLQALLLLKDLLSGTISKERSFLQEFYETFDAFADSSRQVYNQSESLRRVVESETQAVQSSASAIHEIAAMVNKTADGAATLEEVVREANSEVEHSQRSVAELNRLMEEIKGATEHLNQEAEAKMNELEEILRSVGEIKTRTSVINEIVFQTKLLSFNASVEAARAGEAGKGFAVVSDEMGTLARKSGEAAQDIEQIVTNSLKSTEERIASVSESIRNLTHQTLSNLERAVQNTQKAVVSTETIKSLVSKVSQMSQEISSATREQDVGVREVSKALNGLEGSSTELSAVSDSTLKTSLSLSEKTERLSGSIFDLASLMGVRIHRSEKKFDFDAAITAHIDWKMKLNNYMTHPDGSLKPEKVCLDNACALGTWIYGDGQGFRTTNPQLFESLRSSHGEFHKTAANIIKLIDKGQVGEAKKLLGPSGSYSHISERTVGLIRDLKAQSEAGNSARAA